MSDTDTTTPEVWKPIPGYGGTYSASNLGRVRRDAPGPGVLAGHIMSSCVNPKGYLRLGLSVNGRRVSVEVQRLIAAAFFGPQPKGHHVNHKNADPTDNRLENLEYCTPRENVHHAMNLGLMVHGEDMWCAKLTADKVRDIRARYARGDVSQRQLAAEMCVSQNRIYQIVKRKSWKHVD